MTQNEQQAHCYYMQIQPDWQELVAAQEEGGNDAEERCWLDVYERSVHIDNRDNLNDNDEKLRVQIQSAASAHYELELSATSVGQRIAPKDAPSSHQQQQHLVEIAKRENQWIEVHAHIGAYNQQQQQQRIVRTVFQAPTATVNVTAIANDDGVSKRQLHAVDVSNDEKLIAVGGDDGFCALWDALDRTETFALSGHMLDVTRVLFFPSSKVLLTGSLDFTLRIWSAETGQCAAVLKGHRGGIEDIAILGRGRNVLSSSSDGLIHLWSCGTQEVIAKWGNDAQSAVHCLSVLDDSVTKMLIGDSQQGDTPEAHDLEAETEGKVLFAGLESGEVLGVDIRMQQLVMNVQGTGSPILSCAATVSGSVPLLLTGSEDGLLTTWDLRNTSSPLQLLSRSSSPINRIAIASSNPKAPFATAWTAHGDGVCCNWSHLSTGTSDYGNAVSTTELTGPLYDPVRDVVIAPRTGRVFTVCRDGLLRDYIPHCLL